MNYTLSLFLELLQQAPRGLLFRVTARNESTVKLFLPFPTITDLRFGYTATLQEADWSTSVLAQTVAGGFTLDSDETRSFEWQVRPSTVEVAPEPDGNTDWDYWRWCVDLEPGAYLVWYRWRVDKDYFDLDSHMRLPDLERAAEREGAVAWIGQALSNRVKILLA